MPDPYFAVKWIHILSATVLFGTGLGTALHLWLTHRAGDVHAIAVATRNTVKADWWFTLPAGLAQPISGVALIVRASHDPLAGWLIASYALYGVAGLCWLIVVVLQLCLRTLAREAAATGTALPPAYHAAMRAWFWLGWPAFLGLIAVFWLMVAKPTLS